MFQVAGSEAGQVASREEEKGDEREDREEIGADREEGRLLELLARCSQRCLIRLVPSFAHAGQRCPEEEGGPKVVEGADGRDRNQELHAAGEEREAFERR